MAGAWVMSRTLAWTSVGDHVNESKGKREGACVAKTETRARSGKRTKSESTAK